MKPLVFRWVVGIPRCDGVELLDFSRTVFCMPVGKNPNFAAARSQTAAPPFNHALLAIADFINKLDVCANTLDNSDRKVHMYRRTLKPRPKKP